MARGTPRLVLAQGGFGDDLVGHSHECDHQEWVKRLPALTEPKLPTDGTSYEIDQRIKAILRGGRRLPNGRHNHASCPWNRTIWRAYSATSAR